jgi:outer membrane protein OmpA-like peptidoglycan-associated protein
MKRIASATAAVLLITGCLGTTSAMADDPNPTASASSSPPIQVDPHAAGLKLQPGATLAPPKVLDIVSVVEDQNGDERQSDTSSNEMFSLQSEVLFGKDSADLSPDAGSRIQAVADEITKQHATTVRVYGFTDNLGTHEHGMELSKARAQAVYTVLTKDLGNSGSIQFDIRGFAEQYPVADNSTGDGRKKNRRVEISFPKSPGGNTGGSGSGTNG